MMAKELQESIEKQLGVKVSHIYIKVWFDEDSGVPDEDTLDNLPDQIVLCGETFNFGMGTFSSKEDGDSYAEWGYDNYSEKEQNNDQPTA